jgi:hypothetical protein
MHIKIVTILVTFLIFAEIQCALLQKEP